jgi:hypothetical protein
MADEPIDEPEPQVDYESEARKSGWTPEKSFKGDPSKWIDAESWVKRGKEFIPFLQTANRSMKEELAALREQNMQLERMNRANAKALEELKGEVTDQTVATAETARSELKEAIVKAHEDGDIKTELELRDKLADLSETIKVAKAPATVPVTDATRGTVTEQPDATQSPIFKQFLAENPWFQEDRIMAGAAVAAMGELNQTAEGKGMSPEERFRTVADTIKKRFGMVDNPRRGAPSKVESSRMSGNSGGGGDGQT